MKKKIIGSILVVVFVLAQLCVFGACNKGPRANFEIPNDFDGDTFYEKEITIKFYHTMSLTTLQPVLEEYIAAFNELYPNIKVEHEAIGGYDDVRDQLKTEISADNQPNMAYCYPDHVALYNKAKAVISMDELIGSDISIKRADGTTEQLGLTQAQVENFIDGYYAEGKSFGDGLMYTLPFSKSTEVLYYNKTFFTKHELSIPDHWFSNGANDTTSMEYVCGKIKEIDPYCIPLGYDSEANWFITMCEQYGSGYTSATGDHFLFNNETNINFVAKFAEWFSKGWLTTQTLNGSYTSSIFTESPGVDGLNLSSENVHRSYMSIGSSAGATHQRPSKVEYKDDNGFYQDVYPFEVGITPIPQQNPSNPKVISQGPSICIFKDNDPNKVIASWLFLKYLTTSEDFQVAFSQASGYVPVLKSVETNEKYQKAMNKANGTDGIAALSAKVCVEQASYYYTSPAFIGSSTARDQVGALMAACLQNGYKNGQLDLDFIKSKFNDAIDECEYSQ